MVDLTPVPDITVSNFPVLMGKKDDAGKSQKGFKQGYRNVTTHSSRIWAMLLKNR
jgi:hypothetical protein